MSLIKSIQAYEIIDSRGNPTIEGQLVLDNGKEVFTSIPSGASVGKHEAVEFRDNDPQRFGGMGETRSVSFVNDLIAPKLVGVSPLKQQEIDTWLINADGTKDKSRLGANTLLTVSQLMVKAAAVDQGLKLFEYINSLYETIFKEKIPIERVPSPIFNIINGGKHANNNIEFQEFQVIPSSSFSFTKSYQLGVEMFHELKRVLKYRNASVSVGDEGGFAPNFTTNLDALEVINETLIQRNLKPGFDVFIGIDVAASNFFKDERYVIKDKPHPLKRDEFITMLKNIVSLYSILALEDPLDEDDWDGWKMLSTDLADKVYLVGDDLLTTNKERLSRAIKEHSCSTVLVKPNQIGTITETMEVVNLARQNNFNYITSHRSGETNDSFIADFAVGIQSDFVKFGAPSRGERVAKYNRLWQIERDELKKPT